MFTVFITHSIKHDVVAPTATFLAVLPHLTANPKIDKNMDHGWS